MTKVKGRKNSYAIYFGKNDAVNEDKFKKNIVLDDNSKCQVIVSFKDDFDFMIKQRDDKNQQIMTLNNRIKQLEEEIEKKSSSNKASSRELYLKIDELKKTNNKLEKTYQDDLSAIHSKHEKKIEAIQDEYNAKINDLNKELLTQNEYNKKEVIELKDEYITSHQDLQKEIDSLKKEIYELKTSHLKELNELNEKHNQAINNLTIYDEEYHMKLSDHEKKINEMRSICLRLRTIDSNNNLRQIDNLEKLGRLDKFRNKDKEILKEMRQFNQKIVDEDAIDVEFNLIDEDNANNNKR